MTTVSVSILSCYDILTAINQLNKTTCDYIHIDVMDGLFVPEKIDLAEELTNYKTFLKKPIEVHLMVKDVYSYINEYSKLNPVFITIHEEIEEPLDEVIKYIKELGHKVGVSLKPDTDIKSILSVLDKIDIVLIMTVEPGRGGQTFNPDMLKKIKDLKTIINERNLPVQIQVDGGINQETGTQAKEAGADILVSGSYVTSGIIENQVKQLKSIN